MTLHIPPPCTFPGCVNRIRSMDLCDAHYRQQHRGEELRPLRRRSPNKNQRQGETPPPPRPTPHSRPIRAGVPDIPYESPLPEEIQEMAREKVIASGGAHVEYLLDVLGLAS